MYVSFILFSFFSYILIRTTNYPRTPESARQRARAAAQLQQLQMTDPDERRSRSRSVTPPVTAGGFPQPNFLAERIGADLDVPRVPSTPRLNVHLPMHGVSASAVPENSISLNDPEDPFGYNDGPRHNLTPQRLADVYGVNITLPPEVQLPANWDAPLQNPMPTIPPMPMPIFRRRGGRGRAPLGPLHDTLIIVQKFRSCFNRGSRSRSG